VAYPGNNADIYAWHGIIVEARLILHPGSISLHDIGKEFNVETRFVMMTRYGVERYLKDSGAELVHRDSCGVLWSAPFMGEWSVRDPVYIVEVHNASPEPDGSRRRFFLRVPPTMQTAREAVAWTFGKSAVEYTPTVET
jgi:hypothetical protein